ncbi:hypothetical protein [Trinickia mobilis]|uniref:hypothetical protein n=1 Tax=Trinickia mobilis TaxID=2816356 RepID=UPI001A8E7468|nr:hypothetical protein [Trinickia mobilis]
MGQFYIGANTETALDVYDISYAAAKAARAKLDAGGGSGDSTAGNLALNFAHMVHCILQQAAGKAHGASMAADLLLDEAIPLPSVPVA